MRPDLKGKIQTGARESVFLERTFRTEQNIERRGTGSIGSDVLGVGFDARARPRGCLPCLR